MMHVAVCERIHMCLNLKKKSTFRFSNFDGFVVRRSLFHFYQRMCLLFQSINLFFLEFIPYTSCKEIKSASGTSTNGIYDLFDSSKTSTYKVCCFKDF